MSGPRRDAALAVALFLAGVAEVVARIGDVGLQVAAGALISLPLALRSRSAWIPWASLMAGFGLLRAGGLEPEATAHVASLWVVVFTFGALADRRQALLGLAATAVPLSAEFVLTKPGEIVWVLGVFVLPPWLLGRLMHDRRARIDELEALRTELERERARAQRLAVLVERARLARDIEGVLAGSLHGVTQAAQRGRTLDDPAEVAAAFETIRATGANALAELRRLLGLLHGDAGPAAEPPPRPASTV